MFTLFQTYPCYFSPGAFGLAWLHGGEVVYHWQFLNGQCKAFVMVDHVQVL